MTSPRILPEAEADIASAHAWCESREAGLGERFLDAVETSLAAIKARPHDNAFAYKEVRRGRLSRFPFAVFYVVRDEMVVNLAVLHHRRSPRVAQTRVRGFGVE